MLHRIGLRDIEKIPANQNMVIKPDELARFVEVANKKGWCFLSLDEFVGQLLLNKTPEKALALTFDDGYLDNYSLAYPVLKSFDVPFCIYLTSGFIGENIVPWWYKLETVLESAPEVLAPNEARYKLDTIGAKNDAFMEIRNGFMSSQAIANKFSEWLDGLYETTEGYAERLFMNWQEVEALKNSSLVTLGAHTHTHPVLSNLDSKKSYQEIKRSKEVIEGKISKSVEHFAFPFGGYGEVSQREINFTKKMGFKSAVTTRYGVVHSERGFDLFELPRVFFSPGFSIEKMQTDLIRHEIMQIIKRAAWRVRHM